MTEPVVIGIGGLLTSGKDALADQLVVGDTGYEFVKAGMSDPLWDALQALDPVIPLPYLGSYPRLSELTEHNDYVTLKKNDEVRRLLQALGTEVGREIIDKNVWVNIAARRIRERLDEGISTIITGIRFPNELEMIHSFDRHLSIWVTRPGVEDTGAHASENSVSQQDFDIVVNNDGSLEDLYATGRFALDSINSIASADERPRP